MAHMVAHSRLALFLFYEDLYRVVVSMFADNEAVNYTRMLQVVGRMVVSSSS